MIATTCAPFQEESFLQYVERVQPASLPRSPLFHVTTTGRLKKMLVDEQIVPEFCKSMACERTYAFYGRPAYRPRIKTDEDLDPKLQPSEELELANSMLFPVCVVFKPEVIDLAVALFPFDTGAFVSKRFSRYITAQGDDAERRLRCRDFEMKNDFQTPDQFVSEFYGTNLDYFRLFAFDNLAQETNSDDVKAYHKLIKADSPSPELDSRRGALEVQFDIPIPINNAYIDFVALPAGAAVDKKYTEFFIPRNIKIVPYLDTKGRMADHHTSLQNAVFYWLEQAGIVTSLAASIAKSSESGDAS